MGERHSPDAGETTLAAAPTPGRGFSARMHAFSGATALKARGPVWGFLFGPAGPMGVPAHVEVGLKRNGP